MVRVKLPPYKITESPFLTKWRRLQTKQWINTREVRRVRELYISERASEHKERLCMREEESESKRFNRLYGKVLRECNICMKDEPLRQFAQPCDQCNYDLCMTCRVKIIKCPQCRLLYKKRKYIDLT